MAETDYTVLARKYRPQTFEEVLAQDSVSRTLRNAISSNRLAHAYLFTGPRGVGKTTMARILAKALNCAGGPTPKPCGRCDPCREIAASSSIDVLEMDAASHTGVDNVREVIIQTVGLAPSRDRYKVFIIDEAHMLSVPAFNALLKTLEEPPPHVVFILATTEAMKIPPTISSRCQRFRFRPVDLETMAAHLKALAKKESMEVEPAAVELLARHAAGSLRDAVSLLDQAWTLSDKSVTSQTLRGMFGLLPDETLLGIGRAVFQRDARGLAERLDAALAEGIEPAQLLRDLRDSLHEAYLERLGAKPGPGRLWSKATEDVTPAHLGYVLRRINGMLEELRVSDSPATVLELGLFGCLEEAGDLAAWVERLEELERRLGEGEDRGQDARPASPRRPQPSAGAPHGPPPAAAPAAANAFPEGAADARPPALTAPGHDDAPPESGQDARPSGPAPKASAAQAWRGVVQSFNDRPALAAVLGQARLETTGDGGWKLVFARQFDLDQAARHLPSIEAGLAPATGAKVRLALALDSSPAEETGTAEEAGPAPEGMVWQDVVEPGGDSDLPLKKAEKILGGKVKFVKKNQGK
ncbi:MAG: DNA polymerase III subunit gamma/tau [Elusimicrobia bacterium]|nr:DNA polymerase III subunit gamma/tau [Elusimicrobiota bacterium]